MDWRKRFSRKTEMQTKTGLYWIIWIYEYEECNWGPIYVFWLVWNVCKWLYIQFYTELTWILKLLISKSFLKLKTRRKWSVLLSMNFDDYEKISQDKQRTNFARILHFLYRNLWTFATIVDWNNNKPVMWIVNEFYLYRWLDNFVF